MTPTKAAEVLGLSPTLHELAARGYLARGVILERFHFARASRMHLDAVGLPVTPDEIDEALMVLLRVHDGRKSPRTPESL